MNLVVFPQRGDFYPIHQLQRQRQLGNSRGGRSQPIGGVVIGDRQYANPHFNRPLHQLRRCQVAVRGGGMAVEVVKGKRGRLGVAVCQKKYPAMAWPSIIPAIVGRTEIYSGPLTFALMKITHVCR
ncbi:hypothetical protein D3C79_293160 [compost metagenome]